VCGVHALGQMRVQGGSGPLVTHDFYIFFSSSTWWSPGPEGDFA
jgi:hypothetical protein